MLSGECIESREFHADRRQCNEKDGERRRKAADALVQRLVNSMEIADDRVIFTARSDAHYAKNCSKQIS